MSDGRRKGVREGDGREGGRERREEENGGGKGEREKGRERDLVRERVIYCMISYVFKTWTLPLPSPSPDFS